MKLSGIKPDPHLNLNLLWADCVSGALEPEVFLSILSQAGFTDVALACFSGYKTTASAVGALIKASSQGEV